MDILKSTLKNCILTLIRPYFRRLFDLTCLLNIYEPIDEFSIIIDPFVCEVITLILIDLYL